LKKNNTLDRCTLPAIMKMAGAYAIPNDNGNEFVSCFVAEEKRILRRGFTFSRSATHNGYLPAWYVAVIPYIGRWGCGWIIATPHTHDKVEYRYYIAEKG